MFARNVLLTFTTEVTCVGLNFLTGILLARILTPNDRGIMTLAMTFSLMMFCLTNFGLHEGTVYFIDRKKFSPILVMGNILTITCGLSVLIIIILMLLKSVFLSSFMKGFPGEYWLPIIFLVPATLFQGVTLSVLRAKERFISINFLRFLGTLLLLISFSIVLLVFKRGIGACLMVYFVVTILNTLFSLLCVSRYVPISLVFDWTLSQDIFRYGMKSYLQIIFESINYRLDIFLIALFLVPEQVAYYGVATSLAELAWYFPNSVGSVLFPWLSHKPLNEVHQITAQAIRITLLFTGLIIIGLAIVSWILVPMIYGLVYKAAVPALILLLPGILAVAVHKVINRNFASRDRQQITILSSVIAMVIIVGLDLLMIPRWGIVGAAVSSSLGYFVAGLSLLLFFKKDSGLTISSIIFIQRSDLIYLKRLLKLIIHTKEPQANP